MLHSPRPPAAADTRGLDRPGELLHEPIGESPADRRFVRSLFIDLLGRSPLPREWTQALDQTRAALIGSLLGTREFYAAFYEEELFYFLLLDNFRPSTDVFAALPEYLAERRRTVRDALRSLVSSQFFNARNPGNDTFVTVLLEQLLGMTVQQEVATLEAGKRMYDGKEVRFLGSVGSSQADLVRIAVEHEDFEPHLLGRKFEAIFFSRPGRDELSRDATALREDPHSYPEILGRWVSSAAYDARLEEPRSKNDRVFIRSLFADLLGREAEYQEFRRCRNALLAMSDSRPLRSVLIKLVLDSGQVELPVPGQDREPFVDRLFLRFLCRLPSVKERDAFVKEAGRAPTRTLVRALLTHPEYQWY